jgi:hypothetical protein
MNLKFENKVALDLIQVLIGAISSNVRGISFECFDKSVIVYYLIEVDDFDDRDEAEDLVSEFEALQSGPFDIEFHVIVSSEELHENPDLLKGRRIYGRKEN